MMGSATRMFGTPATGLRGSASQSQAAHIAAALVK